MNWRPNIRNRAFDWMGEGYRPLIDPNHFLGHSSFDFPRHSPPANIGQLEKKLVLEICVPGFTKDDLEVKLHNHVLSVKGHRQMPKEETGVEYITEEFATDNFERKFKLDKRFSVDNVEAKCEHGVLRVVFFNDEEEDADGRRSIEVKVA